MSTVLHPVGPEPPQTYWVRRVAVLGAAILVIAVVVALIVNGTSSGSAMTASPAPVTPPPATPVSAGTATPTASAKATATATATALRSPRATQSTTSAKPTAKPAKPTKTPKPTPIVCPAGELRPTLTGKHQLKVKRANTFRLSLINGSGQTCVAQVTTENFELKIYSGTDRIWSTRDCSRAVKTKKKTLAAEQSLAWSIRWNGRRSRENCKNRPELPRPGTYFATAQLDGAKPVQLRMIIV